MVTGEQLDIFSVPVLPYNGSEGNARHATSADRRGVRGETQAAVLDVLRGRQTLGATSAELEQALSMGHGRVSGALSALHRGDEIVMLQDRRDRQYVYVVADCVAGRPTRAPQSNTAHAVLTEAYELIRSGDFDGAADRIAAYASRCSPGVSS